MASAEREPITGVWAEPPAGSRGRTPGLGVWGELPEAECLKEVAFWPFLGVLAP